MKRVYEKPFFVADEYQVTSNIAACEYSVIDSNGLMKPVDIIMGKNYCNFKYDPEKGGDGHDYNDRSVAYGYAKGNTTIFNDGVKTDCYFDWANVNAPVYTSDEEPIKVAGSFAGAFYGNNATVKNHAPANEGLAFFS